ncbi:MAG: ABC transporter substrate-binding protein [Clostridiales bacterium]|nr:ABC transporter substrate-binding protein [Clostridiales bacterium]
MKKKVISSLLVAALAGSLLTACGSGSSTSTSDAASDSSVTESEEGVTTTSYGEYTEEDPYHLVFSYIEFYTQDESAREAVEEAINEYMIPNYHIEVELLPLEYAEYATTVQLMMSGGDELDVVPIYYTYAASWINMGGVYDMSEFMDTEEGQMIVDVLGEENAYVGEMNGILYGFSANKESVNLSGLCMRADICDELGLTEEYNLDENGDTFTEAYDWSVATEIFARVQEAYPDMTPLYLYSSDQLGNMVDYDGLQDNFGGLILQEDRESLEVVNLYETESVYDMLYTLAKWYDAGYIYQDAATDTQGTATMMKAGNTFSYVTSIKPGFLAEAEAANGCDCYVMYFKQDGGTDGMIATTNVSFFNTGIASNSEDPEMAFKFVSALYNDATLMNLWQYGIEDVNYQVLDDGTAYYIDGEGDGNYAYHQNTGWAMGNQFISYVWNDGTKTADYWDQLAAFNDNAYYSPAFGFMWDSSDYSTQITALSNALETYRATLTTGSCGTAGLDSTLQSLNDALYAAGLEEVMAAKQEQLDAWAAEQE